ncbi:MAG TPA: DMT family transporter [Candidatus Limnocylindrales bacterium]|nr:DMT family transporter [Candidatus Limnocylindrales bacterium]
MNLSKHQLAVLSLITANVIWGASFPIYKWSLQNIPPFTFVFLRFFLGAILIFPFAVGKLHIKKHDRLKIFISSTFGITLAISFLFLGLRLAPSINAPIIFSSSPAILLLVAFFYLKERPKKKIIIGTIISLIGVVLIVISPILEKGLGGAVYGNLFFILAILCDIMSTVIIKKFIKDYSTITVVFWSFIIGSLLLFPLVIYEAQQFSFLTQLTYQGLIGISYGVLFAAVAAHLLFNYGIKYIKTSEIGIFSYVDPIATATVATHLLGEAITFYYLLGAILVFAGIFIAERRIHYHPLHLLKKDRDD